MSKSTAWQSDETTLRSLDAWSSRGAGGASAAAAPPPSRPPPPGAAAGAFAAASGPSVFARARALCPYTAQMECDLSFRAGDVITVITRTERYNDWWEGELNGKRGLFPAPFVQVL